MTLKTKLEASVMEDDFKLNPSTFGNLILYSGCLSDVREIEGHYVRNYTSLQHDIGTSNLQTLMELQQK